jgi:ketosteroid isomerase-like protein
MTDNSAVIRGIYAAFARGDVPGSFSSMAPDIAWAEAEGFPYAGTYSGKYRATGKSFIAPFEHVWKLRDGKVVAMRQHTDTLVVQRALS